MTATTPTKPASAQGAVAGDWLAKAKELYERCKYWPENTADGRIALLELRNHVHTLFAASPPPTASPPSPGEVRIKPLDWDSGYAFVSPWSGWYLIGNSPRGWRLSSYGFQGGPTGVFDTQDEAKAAAQADYEARIRSALASAAPANSNAGDEDVRGALDLPMGAIENGRAFADRLETTGLECPAGDLRMCSDWQEFRRCFDWLAEWALSVPARVAIERLDASLDGAAEGLCTLATPETESRDGD